MRYFLHLAYNGTRFCGWQIQPKSVSVQETVQSVISVLLKETITITGAGRTDSGVHASSFYAHFDTDAIFSTTDLCYRLNRMLAYDIVVFNIFSVKNTLHARFSAISRTYKYNVTQQKNPFAAETEYYFPHKLDVEKMNIAAQKLVDTMDFTSFSKLHTDVANNICSVSEAFWVEDNNKLVFTITANRFLRNMVRSIVGTLLDVGLNKISVADFCSIIESKNRQNAGQSIPACGLTLFNIEYPDFE